MSRDDDQARALLESQFLAVLCTQGKTGPYSSLMAYVYSRDRDVVYMVTRTGSEKYRNIMRCPRVALLIDDRCRATDGSDSLIPSLTVQGAVITEKQNESQEMRQKLGLRFPAILPLLEKKESTILCIELDHYLLLEGPEKAVKGNFRVDKHLE